MRQAARDVGLTVFVRCVNLRVLLVVDNCRVHKGSGGISEGWSSLRGSGGHIAVFLKWRWSDACALSAGGVQTECVGAMGGLGCFPLEHLLLGCKCRGVGTLLASDGASSIEDVSTYDAVVMLLI
jgi:hypothetical protein